MEASDQELLRDYVADHSEGAFRQLVERHLGMVYATACRVTGDHHRAEEVVQATFLVLAREAGQLREHQVPAGWLHHTARHLAWRTVRSDQRRQQREQLAAPLPEPQSTTGTMTGRLDSLLEQLGQLAPPDRDALVLRFLEGRNLREVGRELGLTEDAARMRVNRALEKLRSVLEKLGYTGTAAGLAGALSAATAAAAPATLGPAILSSVFGGTGLATTVALTTQMTAQSTMKLFSLKTAAALIGAAALTGGSVYLVKEREARQLASTVRTLQRSQADLLAAQQRNEADLALRENRLQQLQREAADLPRLRGQVDALNRRIAELAAREAELVAAQRQFVAGVGPTETGSPAAADSVDLAVADVEKAFTIARLSQHRQLGLAVIMYADDHGGRLPANLQTPSLTSASMTWRRVFWRESSWSWLAALRPSFPMTSSAGSSWPGTGRPGGHGRGGSRWFTPFWMATPRSCKRGIRPKSPPLSGRGPRRR